MGFGELHPNVKLRVVLSFCQNALGNMITPFMAVYFAGELGTTAAGAATMAAILVGVACGLVGGHYADRLGRKKLLIAAETLQTAAYAVMALANSPWYHSATVTLVMTAAVNAAWGLGKPAFGAMLIDVTTPENRATVYRLTYWSNNLAMSVAGLIGAFLFKAYLFQLLVAVAGMTALSLLLSAAFLTETLPATAADGGGKGSVVKTYRRVLWDKRFLLFLTAGILIVSVEMNLIGYIGIRMDRFMHGVPWFPGSGGKVDGLQMMGVLRTENTAGVVLLTLIVGRLLRRRSDGAAMIAGIVVNFAGYLYMVVGNQPLLLVFAMLAATIGELAYVPIKEAMLAALVPDGARSSYVAVYGMGGRAAQLLCGLNVMLGGFLAPAGMAVWIGAAGFAGLLMLAGVMRQVDGKGRSREAAAQTA